MINPSPVYVQLVESAARAVVNAREMCGNESAALREWEDENGELLPTTRALVLNHVERIWAGYQADAGVTKPIDNAERKAITKALED